MKEARTTGHISRGPRRGLHHAALAALWACALLLTGCAAGPPGQHAGHGPAGPPGTTATAVPPGLADHYRQKLRWTPCEEQPSFQCTTLRAPLDYARPESGDIRLAATRKKATGTGARHIGSLLFNPGGPGEPAITSLWSFAGAFSPAVRASYDLVAVDPRGVGSSTPVNCGGDAAGTPAAVRGLPGSGGPDEDGPATEPHADGPDFAAADEAARETATACERGAGRLLPHVGTLDSARDLELVRALLGDERLHYLGFSYGSYLGASYAGLFPSRVGRMVLDGAVDPTLDGVHSLLGQARGYQIAWDSFAADCAARPACPVGHSAAEAGPALDALVDALDRAPLRQGKDVVVDGDSLISAVTTALMAPAWEKLRAALREVRTGDTTTVQELGGAFEDSGFSGDAYVAITCLSGSLGARATPAQARAALPGFLRASPRFGRYFADQLSTCAHWPVPADQPAGPITAPGAPPILVVGTTRDPATPYTEARALARLLSSGRLLTYDGDGHTAYLRSVGCVDDAVDRYLIRGQLPPTGTVCA
ncbi:alpha/beta hydrolase [Actinacidiphila glaucinigra]|uniref:alpha/beta hydrolase n=1 Tax=Actinacidiphila glaucinigra TaxID=235986 RepID=UPI0037C5E5A7